MMCKRKSNEYIHYFLVSYIASLICISFCTHCILFISKDVLAQSVNEKVRSFMKFNIFIENLIACF